MVQRVTGENTYTLEMYQGREGAEAKTMQIDYRRARKKTAKK
jgi:hypothetical protein